MSSKSFGTQHAKIEHLTEGKTGLAGEIDDLRHDVEVGFENNEGKVGFPSLEWLDGSAPTAAGSTVVLRGSALNQSQTFDTLTLSSSTARLVTTAMKPGNSGIKMKFLAPSGAASVAYSEYDAVSLTSGSAVVTLTAVAPGASGLQAEMLAPQGTLSVTYHPVGKKISIQLAAAGSTSQQIVDALNANATIAALVTATVGNAATASTAVAATALANGRVLIVQLAATTGSTASEIATLINADNAACKGKLWASVTVGDATPFAAAMAATPLAGGVGDYDGNAVLFSGVEGLPLNTTGATGTAKWTDTLITVASPDLTAVSPARATSDLVTIVVKSNGVRTNSLTAQLGGGTVGPQGDQGLQGNQGNQGRQGLQGNQGPT
ncbi:hypothetical protein UFOVP276_79 [uncultured Caudovirales phage]|uniref:Uncharacterized protein n=1 Tax=uncultured Caudovirales phage TaxID=2100421 RepID=A0A6J5LC80_9CAUD|nr:hypothetical protein UFOVP127_216 [uncultured Caudovirales phage]CAB4135119.1 hypothetical protein UFOVP276_79 [uncultured Caudovirales phage]